MGRKSTLMNSAGVVEIDDGVSCLMVSLSKIFISWSIENSRLFQRPADGDTRRLRKYGCIAYPSQEDPLELFKRSITEEERKSLKSWNILAWVSEIGWRRMLISYLEVKDKALTLSMATLVRPRFSCWTSIRSSWSKQVIWWWLCKEKLVRAS